MVSDSKIIYAFKFFFIFGTFLLLFPMAIHSQTALDNLDTSAIDTPSTQPNSVSSSIALTRDKIKAKLAKAKKEIAFQKWIGTVTASPSLNVRDAVWGTILGSLLPDSRVTVTGTDGEWLTIQYNGKTAYVYAKYISRDTNQLPETQTVQKPDEYESWTGYVTTSCLNIRTAPWGTIVTTYSAGQAAKVIGIDGEWYRIEVPGQTLYAHSSYISKDKPADTVTGSATQGSISSPSANSSSSGNNNVTGDFGGSPVDGGWISSTFGNRIHPITGEYKMHNGVDVAIGAGTPIKSLGSGVVISSGMTSGGYGNLVKVQYDNGYIAYYAHLQSCGVSVGDKVTRNMVLGAVNSTGSSTGNHLHFELRTSDGTAVDPCTVPGVSICK
ncbi:MAG: hypothetical protein CVV64_12280 [Candidatus Wallbacteria bacterium HGW-Wallbacteria-1]|uniref:SH3b domain-containing protein n=1 Tax=Candidatus Wallbacteria bacterium HGW-Wallbacteria-1 TaxID=2013854 RepID=A0A2N1PNR8_9BACT|nr:MAG: hypothetical protein CVV64_12280 [Candidatus Wallbacteria bacterium HGW-Wallbacteria-1]